MNRQQRRPHARIARQQRGRDREQHNARATKTSTITRDFYETDAFLDQLESGYVDDERGIIVRTNFSKTRYAVLPAMEGWMEFWREVATRQGIDYEDAPLQRVVNMLKYDMPMTLDHVHKARAVVEAQRAMYLQVPSRILNEIADEVQARIRAEDQAEQQQEAA